MNIIFLSLIIWKPLKYCENAIGPWDEKVWLHLARPFEKQHVESCPFDKAVAIWEELYTLGLASLLKTKYIFIFLFRLSRLYSTNNSRLYPTLIPSLIQHWPSLPNTGQHWHIANASNVIFEMKTKCFRKSFGFHVSIAFSHQRTVAKR